MAPPAAKRNEPVRFVAATAAGDVATGWAAERARLDPSLKVEVSTGTSEGSIKGLLQGTADVSLANRKLSSQEVEGLRGQSAGKAPRELLVGFDVLCVHVNIANPLRQLSVEELAAIQSGRVTRWQDLERKPSGWTKGRKIVRLEPPRDHRARLYARELLSGQEADASTPSLAMAGSKDLTAILGATPEAIGYSSECTPTPTTAILAISVKKGKGPAVAPTAENIASQAYPLARPLFVAATGSASEGVKRYLDWVSSQDGRAVLDKLGYVRAPSAKP